MSPWNSERRGEVRRQRRAHGLCIQCGRPSGGLYLCAEHNAAKNEALLRKRRLWAARGLCYECGRPTGGHYRCPRHALAHNISQARLRGKWMAAGRCQHCGRDLSMLGPDYGLSSCAICQQGWDERFRQIRKRR